MPLRDSRRRRSAEASGAFSPDAPAMGSMLHSQTLCNNSHARSQFGPIARRLRRYGPQASKWSTWSKERCVGGNMLALWFKWYRHR